MIAALLLLTAACQRQEKVDVTNDGAAATTTMSPSAAPATTAAEPSSRPSTAEPVQEVHLMEYQIHLPDSVPAGRLTFQVENGGKEDHGFEIEGNGIEQKTSILKRGDTATLDVTLPAGTYTVYCPVEGHKEKGMKRTLVVK